MPTRTSLYMISKHSRDSKEYISHQVHEGFDSQIQETAFSSASQIHIESYLATAYRISQLHCLFDIILINNAITKSHTNDYLQQGLLQTLREDI